MRSLSFLIIFFCLCFGAFSQTPVSWETLSDVRFTDKYSDEVEAIVLYPHFGKGVLALDGKEVSIKGYLLIVDPESNIYVLSKNPFSACFFCGNAGPESIIELRLKPGHGKFKMDQVVSMKGRFKLNQDDVYQCNYILEEAEVIK